MYCWVSIGFGSSRLYKLLRDSYYNGAFILISFKCIERWIMTVDYLLIYQIEWCLRLKDSGDCLKIIKKHGTCQSGD